jgi:SAM-dependent methyltransferase
VLARNDEIVDALGAPPRINSLIDSGLFRRRLADDRSDAATLARLFRLTLPVPLPDAARALAPLDPGALVDLELASVDDEALTLRVRLSAYEGLALASDPLDPAARSFVAGPNPSATRVDRLTIRRPVARTLDLGTGAGTQAFLAARHSDEVLAVDVNERALELAGLNAELNGIENVELRRGDWFEPVAGERFDLIVSNPPYVVSPETELLYRDGTLVADAVTRKLVLEAPEHLAEGGIAQLMGNWAHRADEDWRAPVEKWIAGSGCDALLLRFAGADLATYAGSWNLGFVAEGAEPFLAAVDRWLDYYREEGIEAIAEAMVVLRKRSGRNWVRAIEIPGSPTGAAGEQVLRMIAARDRREEVGGDDAVLGARFACAPGLKMTTKARGPGFAMSSSTIELEEAGIGFAAPVSAELAEALPRLDGSEELHATAPAVAPAEARRLFSLGLLTILT